MKDKYPFFKYVPGDSKVHLMNSKMKILWFLLSFIIILVLKEPISILLFCILLIFIIFNTKINLFAYLSNSSLIWPLYLLGFIIAFAITFKVYIGLLIALKLFLMIMMLLILTFTTSLSEISWGFECLFSKLKKINIPVSKISLKIAFYIKFISTLFEQYKSIKKSMAYRGVPSNNKLKTFRKIFVPIVRLSYKLATRMTTAMKLRFYGFSKRRTNYHENKKTTFDKLLIIGNFILIYISVWLGWLR